MDQQVRSPDRSWTRVLHRGYSTVWVLLGLGPPAVAAWDQPAATRYAALALLAGLGASYAIVRVLPGNPVLRPLTYLGLLVLGLGGMSYLLGGGAALFVAALPQFWIFTRSPRDAVAFSGAGAATTVAGGALQQGLLTGNALFTVLGYAVGAGVGLLVSRALADSAARTARLRAELASTQQRLVEAYQRQGAADERERLARDIHDTLAQGLASIVVLAEAARTSLETEPDQSARQLHSIEQTARENLAEARILVGSAPRTDVAAGAIARTLRRVLERFAEDTGVVIDADLPDIACDQPARIALLRCTQESLANVRKHAGATTVSVVLARQPGGIELEITDDGRGFVVADARGFGLDGMRKRLAEHGGDLSVTSAPGEGTRVCATIPMNGQV
jgi:signal transduction histidine kinase